MDCFGVLHHSGGPSDHFKDREHLQDQLIGVDQVCHLYLCSWSGWEYLPVLHPQVVYMVSTIKHSTNHLHFLVLINEEGNHAGHGLQEHPHLGQIQ